MKFLYKVIILLVFVSLQSCSKDQKQISQIKEISQEDEIIERVLIFWRMVIHFMQQKILRSRAILSPITMGI